MTDHRQIPSKIKPRLFTSCFNRGNDRAEFEEMWKKNFIVLSSLWPDDIDKKTM